MQFVRRIKMFKAASYFAGFALAAVCLWQLKPIVNHTGNLDQLALTILFIGAMTGLGTAMKIILMLVLPKSFWELA